MTTVDTAARFALQLGVLGERVRAARRFRGWSQQELGAHSGLDRGKVSKIETGLVNFTLDVLWWMATAFRVHWADLVDGPALGPPGEPYDPLPVEQQLAAFGLRVYQARKLNRVPQRALAARAGVSRGRISQIEHGQDNVKLATLSGLAAGLEVGWSDLLDDRAALPLPPRPRPLQVQPHRPRPRVRVRMVRGQVMRPRQFDLDDTGEL